MNPPHPVKRWATRLRRLLLLPLAVGSVSCASSSIVEPGTDQIVVRATDAGLEATNRTSTTIFYFALSSDALAYTDWAPGLCMAIPECPVLRSGDHVVLPWATLGPLFPDRAYTFHWWIAIPDAHGGSMPGTVHQVGVLR